MSYAALSDSDKAKVRNVCDGIVEMLNDYADMMERGEIDMRSGPDALREVAATLNLALIQQDP